MTEVRGKRVLVVGLARSGRAAARCFARRGAVVTVTDLRPPSVFQAEIQEMMAHKVGLELGAHREETFLRQNLIVVSPGVAWDMPLLEAARRKNIPVVPEVEAASWFLKQPLVGITGSNGKTTAATILGKMLQASGFPAFVGGNIGVPLISAVSEVSDDSLLVVELSSFQLEAIRTLRPRVAVLLNLSANHLDRHASFSDYVAAKARIFLNQTAEDYAVLNADDPNVMSLAPTLAAQKIFFSRWQDLPDGVFLANGKVRYRVGNLERVLLEASDVRLRGAFNVENVMAAAAAACVLGADFAALRRAVREFRGVEHRLEFVRAVRGVEFYNDSKATSVDATAKSLSAFERGVHLILGGKDKGSPYGPLRPLLKGRVRDVFLLGAAAERIARELSGATELLHAGDLEMAVRQAFARALPGEVVLLAPACSSYDQFQDFEHRGRVFKEIVAKLGEEAEQDSAPGKASLGAKGGDGPTAGSDPSSQACGAQSSNLKSEISNFNSQTFDPESRAPGPQPRAPHAAPPFIYEVGAEEVAPLKIDPPANGSDDEWSAARGEPRNSSETAEGEALPFEVLSTAGAPADTSGRPEAPRATEKKDLPAEDLKNRGKVPRS